MTCYNGKQIPLKKLQYACIHVERYGRCRDGKYCRDAAARKETEERRAKAASNGKKVMARCCHEEKYNYCIDGQQCKDYIQRQADFKTILLLNRGKIVAQCSHEATRGKCKHGASCDEAIMRLEAKTSGRMCIHIKEMGFCIHGAECTNYKQRLARAAKEEADRLSKKYTIVFDDDDEEDDEEEEKECEEHCEDDELIEQVLTMMSSLSLMYPVDEETMLKRRDIARQNPMKPLVF